MEFYDVSTPSGKLRLYLSRLLTWRWIWAFVGAVALVGIVAVIGTASSSGSASTGNVLESGSGLQGGQPILKAAAGGVKGKSVPPWLPGFLDTFPWINKTVIDKLNDEVDPNWGTWPTGPNFVQSTGGLKAVPGGGGATKGIPDWLPGFLDNFPWINKTVVDKLNDKIAAQTAYQELQGVLKATPPGGKPLGPKPVPAWLPDFLNNFPWINKTVIDKLNDRVAPEDEAEGVNTLKLKLAVEEVADNSAAVDKGVPAWLPGFLDNFPWINKTVIDKLNDKVAPGGSVLMSAAPLQAVGGVKGKSVPPWLPGFLDTFPWINKTVIDKLNDQVDPTWGTWPTGPNFVQSTGGLKAVPGGGGATKGIPDWLPGFLDNFPWINKTVVDKLNDKIAAQTAYQELQGVLKATPPGGKPLGPKPVPAWLPDFLNNFPWINKTVIDKLNDRVAPEDEAEGVNTLKLKLAVEEVADNSAGVDKGVPAWLPGFLDNFPWINKTVIDKLNDKVAPGGSVLMSAAPLQAVGGVKGKSVPPWLPGFLDSFPWINKTVIDKLNDQVDPTWGSWGPAYGGPVLQSSAPLKDAAPSAVGPKKTIPEWLPGFLDELPWVNKSVIYKIDAVIKAQEAKDKALMVNATPILKATPGAGGKNKTIPAWLPDFLSNFPWINQTVIDRLNDFKEPLAEDDEPQSYNMLKLKLAVNEVAEESKGTKPIPPWLPAFLDNFITNKTVIAELNQKVANSVPVTTYG